MNEMSSLGKIKTDLASALCVHLRCEGGRVTLCGKNVFGWDIRSTPNRLLTLNDWICPMCSKAETLAIQSKRVTQPKLVTEEAAE